MFATSLVFALLLALYSRSLASPYFFDDLDAYGGNLDHVSFPQWRDWLSPIKRPFFQAWLAIVPQMGNTPRVYYRVAALAVHALNGTLILLLVLRVRSCRENRELSSSDLKFATAVALLWLVHPLNSSALIHVVQHSEVLATMFFSVYLLLISFRHRVRNRTLSLLMLVTFLAGLQAKLVMIAAVPAGILLDAYLEGATVKQTISRGTALHAPVLAAVALASMAVVPVIFSASGSVGYGGESPPLTAYALSQMQAILKYMQLVLWPMALSIDRSPQFAATFSEVIAPFSMFFVYIAVAVYNFRKGTDGSSPFRRRVSFLMLLPLIMLAPTSSFVPTADPFFEHRVYFASAFWIWLVLELIAWGFEYFAQRLPMRRQFTVSLAVLAFLLVCLLLGSRTFIRSLDYKSPFAIWQSALLVDGANRRAAQNFVTAMEQEGRAAEVGLELGKLALALDAEGKPYSAILHEIAKTHLYAGDFRKAVEILRHLASFTRSPDSMVTNRQRREAGEIWFEFTLASFQLNDNSSAVLGIERTLLFTPEDPFALALAGDIHLAAGRPDLALRSWRYALLNSKASWPELELKIREATESLAP